jgi:uroporphyrinogen-III synthase
MRLLVTRPEPDATRQARALTKRGHEAVLAPLLAIEFLPETPLELDGAQALIVTSRNALRALAAHPQLPDALALPLVAVGEATAKAAAELGFLDVTTGPGTAEGLATLIPESFGVDGGPLVHISGENIAFDLRSKLEAKGFAVRRLIVYRAVAAKALPPEALASLKAGELNGVILMSPGTAASLVRLVFAHGATTEASRLNCYCLSGAVAREAEPLKAPLKIASRPREEDILALIDSGTASS